jgi:hypothetical protein
MNRLNHGDGGKNFDSRDQVTQSVRVQFQNRPDVALFHALSNP